MMMLISFLSEMGSLGRNLYFKCTTVIFLLWNFSVAIYISAETLRKMKDGAFSVACIRLFLLPSLISYWEATIL